jgi:hypothetical protein
MMPVELIAASTVFFLSIAPPAFLANPKVVRDYGSEVCGLRLTSLLYSQGFYGKNSCEKFVQICAICAQMRGKSVEFFAVKIFFLLRRLEVV